jgi:hypothetical protein
MVKVTVAGLVIGLIAGNVAVAQGQGRRGGPGMFRQSPAMLIGREEVQKELKLEGDQVAQANAIRDEMFQGFRRGGQGEQLSDEERAKRREEQEKKTAELNKKAMGLLNAEQATRMKQVEIWVNGVALALSDNADVTKELNLTDDQKGAVKTISDEAGKKRQELFSGFRGASEEDRRKIMEQSDTLTKETESECMAVLTDDQKAKFDKLRGPKFEMPRFGGGGGRRGRPGGGNN